MIELGHLYRDTLTGVEGFATARTEFLNSPASVCLVANINGTLTENWVTEDRLEAANGSHPATPGFSPTSRSSP